MMTKHMLLPGLLALIVGCAHAPPSSEAAPRVDPPPDKPVTAYSDPQVQKLMAAIAPLVQQARATWPGTKRRYQAGLPEGAALFVTVQLHDAAGKMEQVFVQVVSIQASTITGVIWNDIRTVTGFQKGQEYSFPESELIDWTISNADGTEEGNVVGTFLDTWDGRVP